MISALCIVSGCLLVSFAANAYLFIKLRKKPKRPLSIEAEELLSDLTSGAALVRITPIDQRHVFFRSIKG